LLQKNAQRFAMQTTITFEMNHV